MSICRLLFVVASVAVVAACSKEVSPLEQICKDEIARKVSETNMIIDSSEISNISTDADGSVIVTGKAELTEGVAKKSMPFSCVMQGEGQGASVVRAELIYN